MRQAVSAFQKVQGLPVNGRLDAEVMGRLRAASQGAVTSTYEITQQDVSASYLGIVPTELEAQAGRRLWATPISSKRWPSAFM